MLFLAIAGAGISAGAEGPWTVVGAVAAIVAAIVVIISGAYEFVAHPMLRRRRLKTPCRAWFAISSLNQRTIDYAVQDGREHYLHELTLAANSEYEIEVLYQPTIGFIASEIYFGCNAQDNRDIDRKPTIESFCSRFVERGTSEESPETHPDTNSTDRHKYYHLKKQKNVARDEIYSMGFKIKTRGSGRYEFRIFFVGEEVGCIKNKLFIRVEEHPATRMRCVLKEHRWTGCFIQPVERHE